MRSVIAAIAACLLAITAVPALAASNIMFVLDASNSMWGQVDGRPKIDIAREALGRLMSDLPPDTKFGLLAYGHVDETSCNSAQVLSPIGGSSSTDVSALLNSIVPKGKTPIAFSIAQAAREFGDDTRGQNNSIVLISDGLETCAGDPCATAGQLAAANIGLKVHVVGFDISEDDRKSLECIAEQGGGQYFAASDTEGFKAAVSEAVVAAQSAPPAPEPQAAIVGEPSFVDEFEGGEPLPHWKIANPNPDGYIVENGALLLVNSGEAGFQIPQTPNRFYLDGPLPPGDWELVADIRPEFATGNDSAWLGIYDDEKNFIGAQLWSEFNDVCERIEVSVIKWTNGEETRFDARLTGSSPCGYGSDDVKAINKAFAQRGGKLSLTKTGRKYTASVEVNPGVKSNEPYRVTTDGVSVIRPRGVPSIAVGQWRDLKGETLLYVDRIAIYPKE